MLCFFSGKSTRILQWIRNIESVFCNVPEQVRFVYIHGPYQSKFDPYKSFVTFYQGFDHSALSRESIEREKNVLYVIDDVGQDCDQHLLRQWITALCHHTNSSIILVAHYIFSRSLKFAKDIVQNTCVFVFAYSPQSQGNLKNFAIQFFGTKWRGFMQAMEDALVGDGSPARFSYLCINFSPLTADRYRVTTNITPEEPPRVFYELSD